MSRKKEKISVQFVGNNSQAVTGSMTYIECGSTGKRILIECGMIQENVSLAADYKLNNAKYDFRAKDIDYVFIMHNHLDHQGALPLLVKRGLNCPVIVPENFSVLYKEMCMDSAKILARNSEDLARMFKKEYPPIYDEADVIESTKLLKEYVIGEKIKLDDDIEFQFIPSGHIINACQLVLWIKNRETIKKIAFTSDLGHIGIKPQYYTNEFSPIPSANLLVGECTYNDVKRSTHQKDREKDLEKIKSVVYDCQEGVGSILVPSFALQRTQVFLTILYDLFSEDNKFTLPIYVCSPLATRVSKLWSISLNQEDGDKWEKVKNWDRVEFVDSFDRLEELMASSTKGIYLAANGMMTCGYSVYIASKLLPNSHNRIMFIGYSSEGSIADKVRKNQRTVMIDGKTVFCRANVIVLNSFSSHMTREDLIKYYTGQFSGQYGCSCQYDAVALVHGEMKGKVEFAKALKEEVSKQNRTTRIIVVNKDTTISL